MSCDFEKELIKWQEHQIKYLQRQVNALEHENKVLKTSQQTVNEAFEGLICAIKNKLLH